MWKKLLDSFVAGHGQLSPRGFLVAAERGYVSLSLLKILLRKIFSAIMIMQSHLLKFHPFGPQVRFDVTRAEEKRVAHYDLEDSDVNSLCGDADMDILGDSVPTAPSPAPGSTTEASISATEATCPGTQRSFHWRRSLIIPTHANAGYGTFAERKNCYVIPKASKPDSREIRSRPWL